MAALMITSCATAEPLPTPATNPPVVFAFTDSSGLATGYAGDYLTGPTNNWSISTNWLRAFNAASVPGQSNYTVVTGPLPPCLVVMWATNNYGPSAWSAPIQYTPPPTIPALTNVTAHN